MGKLEAQIRKKLTDALNPVLLEIQDLNDGCGESYSIKCVSKVFEGKSLVERERYVHSLLSEEIPLLHAMNFRLDTPKN